MNFSQRKYGFLVTFLPTLEKQNVVFHLKAINKKMFFYILHNACLLQHLHKSMYRGYILKQKSVSLKLMSNYRSQIHTSQDYNSNLSQKLFCLTKNVCKLKHE